MDAPPKIQERLRVGARVKTRVLASLDREFVEEVRAARHQYSGFSGEVAAVHDSHGLCYEVRFASGLLAPYNPEEVAVIQIEDQFLNELAYLHTEVARLKAQVKKLELAEASSISTAIEEDDEDT